MTPSRLARFVIARPALALGLPASMVAAPSVVQAEPLWEIGIGGGGGWLPDYPAAGQNHFKGLALPYAVYRGERFQAGERSVARGLFVNADRWEFDVSFAGSLPVDSDDNDAREGLDDLGYLGEIGPSLSYYLQRDEAGNQLRLDLQLRAVLSTDLSDFDYVGLILHPQIAQEFVDVGGVADLEASWSFGLRFADEGVMDLFYEVPLGDANAERRAFDAESGYLGASLFGGVSYPLQDHLKIAFGGGVASYHGAANRDSDLFIDEINVAIGGAVIWSIWQSEAEAR